MEPRVCLGETPLLGAGSSRLSSAWRGPSQLLPPQGKGHPGPQVPSFRPYLLALLTHQSNWSTLHQCIRVLLGKSREQRSAPHPPPPSTPSLAGLRLQPGCGLCGPRGVTSGQLGSDSSIRCPGGIWSCGTLPPELSQDLGTLWPGPSVPAVADQQAGWLGLVSSAGVNGFWPCAVVHTRPQGRQRPSVWLQGPGAGGGGDTGPVMFCRQDARRGWKDGPCPPSAAGALSRPVSPCLHLARLSQAPRFLPGWTPRPPWTSSGPASTCPGSGREGTNAPLRQVLGCTLPAGWGDICLSPSFPGADRRAPGCRSGGRSWCCGSRPQSSLAWWS